MHTPWAGSNSYNLSELNTIQGGVASPCLSSSLPFCVRFNVAVTRHAATLDTEPLAKSYPGGSRTHLFSNHFQYARARFCSSVFQSSWVSAFPFLYRRSDDRMPSVPIVAKKRQEASNTPAIGMVSIARPSNRPRPSTEAATSINPYSPCTIAIRMPITLDAPIKRVRARAIESSATNESSIESFGPVSFVTTGLS